MNSGRRFSHMPRVEVSPPLPPIVPPGVHPGHPAPPGHPGHPGHPAPPMIHPGHPEPPLLVHPSGHPLPPQPSRRLKPPAFVKPIQDQQGSGEQQIIRWGDQQTLTVASGASATIAGQLVRVNRAFPETWTITIFAALISNQDISGQPYKFAVLFNLIIGVGSAQVQFAPFFPSGGFDFIVDSALGTHPVEDYLSITTPYSVVYKTFELPVKDLQIQAAVVSNLLAGPDQVVQVAAFAAPRVLQPQPVQQPPEADAGDDSHSGGGQTTQWMGPGFHPDPLHYR